MKKKLLLILLILPAFSYSQTLSPEAIFSSCGNTKLNWYGQISWTLGDCQIHTYKSTNVMLTQGFLQGKLVSTGIETENINSIHFRFFPNPVKDILQIEMSSIKPERIYLNLFNIDGKKVLTKIIETNQLKDEINFSHLPSGNYILKVSTLNKTWQQSFNIVNID